MAEQRQWIFSHKEVVEALIKKQGLSTGIWQLYIKFGISAANIKQTASADAIPAAIIPVLEIGLQKADEVTGLSADAAALSKRGKAVGRKGKAKKFT